MQNGLNQDAAGRNSKTDRVRTRLAGIAKRLALRGLGAMPIGRRGACFPRKSRHGQTERPWLPSCRRSNCLTMESAGGLRDSATSAIKKGPRRATFHSGRLDSKGKVTVQPKCVEAPRAKVSFLLQTRLFAVFYRCTCRAKTEIFSAAVL
jgi:hypothetical protein